MSVSDFCPALRVLYFSLPMPALSLSCDTLVYMHQNVMQLVIPRQPEFDNGLAGASGGSASAILGTLSKREVLQARSLERFS